MYTVEREFHGKTLKMETGRIAKQTNGAVLVSCGKAVVLVTACMDANKKADGFLPLTVDYVEKTYAAGRIPGGYLKREARLSDHETLTSRLIDRPCRPTFPKSFNCEVQVMATVMSADPEVQTDILAMCGASAALTISNIPFDGPIAGVRIGRVGGEFVINPSFAQVEKSDFEFLVAGSKDAIVMVEGAAEIVPEAELLEGIFFAHKELQTIIEMQEELREKCGREKYAFVPEAGPDADIVKKVQDFLGGKLEAAVTVKDKLERKDALSALKSECVDAIVTDASAEGADSMTKDIKEVFSNEIYTTVRSLAFDKKVRLDGRGFADIRQIDCNVSELPSVHGSALFTRGETQAIVTATLAVGKENTMRRDTLQGDSVRRFFLHYNFPAYSVGEVRFLRGPGRREIGHGTLAQRALETVLPAEKDNPYVIRIVSEITESNGSSSMASVCGGSLALMDAGIQIKAPVAGIAMGLLKSDDDFAILSDILGDEDHLGDMDFKVCGTEEGVTAMQMDIKIKGLAKEIFAEALEQARNGRMHILGEMKKALVEPRSEISKTAPQIVVLKINPNRIRDLIGSGGKTIKSITEAHDISINIEDDGTVTVSGMNAEHMDSGLKVIKALTAEAEVGKIYTGVVKRIESFGAFVEILPGMDGLLHVSEMEDGHTDDVNDVVKKGDQVPVKVLNVDGHGKIKLSRKSALEELGQL